MSKLLHLKQQEDIAIPKNGESDWNCGVYPFDPLTVGMRYKHFSPISKCALEKIPFAPHNQTHCGVIPFLL